jgi:hypothetical protein
MTENDCWDVCLFGLEELNSNIKTAISGSDIAYNDYIRALGSDSDNNKDWDYDIENCYNSFHVTEDISKKYFQYAKQPEIRAKMTKLQMYVEMLEEEIVIINKKISKIMQKKKNAKDFEIVKSIKDVYLLEKEKDKLKVKLFNKEKEHEKYNIENFILNHYNKS